MGVGCTRVVERVAAAMGNLEEAESTFEALVDVEMGGLLFMLPALIQNGLLKYSDRYFKIPSGFYGVAHLFILFAFMALGRVKSIERLRYVSQGEWGKLLGLDRIPEVRTLRKKLQLMTEKEKSLKEWGSALSKDWMEAEPETAGVLYVDGHVRVYHGNKTKLPRRYVARLKLALRGVIDYWVNDSSGRPFFSVSTPFSSGLLTSLKEEIVPRLLRDVPNQPSESDLEKEPYQHRFVLVFDREGYSPVFFKQMREKRIACQTYHKFQKERWPDTEFKDYQITTQRGETITMKLAERGTFLSAKIWVREIRKMGKSGHQTSVLSTDFVSSTPAVALQMFVRWSQENFFKYMLENYELDALAGYSLADVDETKLVVNPVYRQIESSIKSIAAKLARKKAKFHDKQLEETDLSPDQVEPFQLEKAGMLEEIEEMEIELSESKMQRKETDKHIAFSELPDEEKFKVVAPNRKQFVDTIKMIAYRADTAISFLLKEYLARGDDSRPLVRQICQTSADISPDKENKILTINLHHMANNQANKAVRDLCVDLNDSMTIYPGTNYLMRFELGSK